MLDFKALQEETLYPVPNKDEAKEQRHTTLRRLHKLGITRDVIASICRVETKAVSSWYRREASPGYHIARIALDRLGPIITYMSDDLGLNDRDIAKFLLEEPRVPEEEQRDWTYDQWFPEQQAYEESPIIYAASSLEGPLIIGQRIALRYPGRQVEEQAGIIATPESVV